MLKNLVAQVPKGTVQVLTYATYQSIGQETSPLITNVSDRHLTPICLIKNLLEQTKILSIINNHDIRVSAKKMKALCSHDILRKHFNMKHHSWTHILTN